MIFLLTELIKNRLKLKHFKWLLEKTGQASDKFYKD